MRTTSARLQAQDEKYLSTRRRKANRRQRRDEIAKPRDAKKMRPYVYGEER